MTRIELFPVVVAHNTAKQARLRRIRQEEIDALPPVQPDPSGVDFRSFYDRKTGALTTTADDFMRVLEQDGDWT